MLIGPRKGKYVAGYPPCINVPGAGVSITTFHRDYRGGDEGEICSRLMNSAAFPTARALTTKLKGIISSNPAKYLESRVATRNKKALQT